MSKTITISDNAYSIIKKSADNTGLSLTKTLDKLLSETEPSPIIPMAPVGLPVPTATPSPTKTITLDDVKKAMREMEADRKQKKNLALENLTEKDLATAKVTFKDRPDFKEPEKWNSKAWPTV